MDGPKALVIRSLATLSILAVFRVFQIHEVNFRRHADQIFVFLVFFVVALTIMPIHADFRRDVSSQCLLVAACCVMVFVLLSLNI